MTYDVIVIGAGLAGLVATEDLTRKGYRVCLLEARDYVGGALAAPSLFANLPFTLPVYVQGKGSSTDPNPLRILLDRLNIPTYPVDSFNADAYDHTGQACSMRQVINELKPAIQKISEKIQLAKRKIIAQTTSSEHPARTIQSVLNNFFAGKPPTSKTIWLQKLITASVEQELGTEPTTASLVNLFDNQRFEGQPELMFEGYLQLMNYFQSRILSHTSTRTEMRLSHSIQTITRTDNSTEPNSMIQVKIQPAEPADPANPAEQEKSSSSKTETLSAHTVILALPLAVLKHGNIKFSPSLSHTKQKILKHFNPGFRNHVSLEFEQPFWPQSVHYLFPNDPNDPRAWPRYLNLFHFLSQTGKQPKPILISECFGKSANFKHLSDSQILERCLAPLKRCYHDKKIKLLNYSISHWDQDEYTLGGGAFCNAQAVVSDLDTIREPDFPGIYFAHEFCSQNSRATLEGAYEAGIRAALEVQAYFKNSPAIKVRPKSSPKSGRS